MTLIAVLDYEIGNLRSAQKALEHLGADARLTADRDLIGEAAGVVLPGVGSFGRCMEALRARGLDEVAHEVIAAGPPFIGRSEERRVGKEWVSTCRSRWSPYH